MELKYKKVIEENRQDGIIFFHFTQWDAFIGDKKVTIERFSINRKSSYRGQVYRKYNGEYIPAYLDPKYFAERLEDIKSILVKDMIIANEIKKLEQAEKEETREAVIPKERKDLND